MLSLKNIFFRYLFNFKEDLKVLSGKISKGLEVVPVDSYFFTDIPLDAVLEDAEFLSINHL
jgi:hypothetical protein